ncbi:MAG: ROK family protein, partial [Candidatus Gastranaerophilales bacterium]|nr:ROK family protein [Candidatus Gastranaerophilales bacterium]
MKKYSIGIDLGGTKILTGIVNKENGEIISYVKKKTKKDKGQEKIAQKIINSINTVLEESGNNLSEINEIGIGAAGQINREKGIIINAPNLDCEDLHLKEILEKKFNKPVLLGNDVEIATIGEMYFGAGKNERDFVCIFVGTGIGSGIVENGHLRYGTT